MTKKLSIVRFKPKPEHFDEFVQLLKTRHESDPALTDTKIMTTDEEVVGIVVRDTKIFQKTFNQAWNTSIPSDTCCKSTTP